MKISIVIIIAVFAAVSCNKQTILFDTYSYMQTQCADPWPYGNSDTANARNLSTWLINQNINPQSVTLNATSSGGIVCTACNCPTGKIYRVTILPDTAANRQLILLGFKK